MSHFIIDVEADGPAPFQGSMIQLGAVLVDRDGKFNHTFYREMYPISNYYEEERLSYIGLTRQQCENIETSPNQAMKELRNWILENTYRGKPVYWSDNLAFDWMWLNTYFHYFTGGNPFGFSGRRIGDLFAGCKQDTFAKWKNLRDTKHTHHPVDDAIGNAEALLKIINFYNIKIKL